MGRHRSPIYPLHKNSPRELLNVLYMDSLRKRESLPPGDPRYSHYTAILARLEEITDARAHREATITDPTLAAAREARVSLRADERRRKDALSALWLAFQAAFMELGRDSANYRAHLMRLARVLKQTSTTFDAIYVPPGEP